MSRLQRFHLLTIEEVRNSPSRADGVPENMEARRRKLAAQHMRQVCYDMRMGITTWAIAVTFFTRFYARKSMKKNNTFIVACASLFLAGKVNDEPRSHEKIANMLLKEWFGKDNPQLQELSLLAPGVAAQGGAAPRQHPAGQRAALSRAPSPGTPTTPTAGGHSPTFWQDMWAAVLEAERALLYTVGFDFNIEIIHTYVARLLNRPRFRKIGLQSNVNFQQKLIALSNDIYHKDATVVLQYPTEKIALAAFYFFFKAAKTHRFAGIPQPEEGANGVRWYVEEGLSAAECAELTNRFDRLYSAAATGGQKTGAGGRPTPSTATGAASTAMLGACQSAAHSGGPSLGGVTALMGAARSDLLSDGLGEHTSVPRPAASDAGQALSGAGSKRPAAGPPEGTPPFSVAASSAATAAGAGGHPSKRARAEPAAGAGSADATSEAQTVMTHPALANGHSPASGRAGGAGRPAAPPAAAVVPPVCASTHVTPADPAVDSEKEEGELEEGELA